MEQGFWEGVAAQGHPVPHDRSLVELTTELTVMLGDPDPHVRDGLAYPTLATWVGEGVYDDLLEGLGDGMASGLTVGLGEDGTDTVFRRSFSALVLAECVARATERGLLPDEVVLRWGDRLAGWLVRERDLRGYVPGKGWAHAVAHGADALGVLAGVAGPRSAGAHRAARRGRRPAADRHRRAPGARRGRPAGRGDDAGAAPRPGRDRGAGALGGAAGGAGRADRRAPSVVGATAQAFLRALHLQVRSALPPRPAARTCCSCSSTRCAPDNPRLPDLTGPALPRVGEMSRSD